MKVQAFPLQRNGGIYTGDRVYAAYDGPEQALLDIFNAAEDIHSLAELKQKLANLHESTHVAIVAFSPQDASIYMGTTVDAQIFVKRSGVTEKIVSDGKSASGYMKEGDVLILSTSGLVHYLGVHDDVLWYITERSPDEMVQTLEADEELPDDIHFMALDFQAAIAPAFTVAEEEPSPEPAQSQPFTAAPPPGPAKPSMVAVWRERLGAKGLIILALVIVFIIAATGVAIALNMPSGPTSPLSEKATKTPEAIIAKALEDAQNAGYADLSSAENYLDIARRAVATAKMDKKKTTAQIAELESQITKAENAIFKREEVTPEEFFDLHVDNAKAAGLTMSLSGDTVSVLDAGQGAVYRVNLDKRSYEKSEGAVLKEAKSVGAYEAIDYVLTKSDGIYLVKDKKATKAIDKDIDWSNPTSLAVYSGNIYLVDEGQNDILRYVSSSETVFATPSSYFGEGEAPDMTGARNLAIDQSLYIGFPDNILKFLSGVRSEFKFSLPGSDVALTAIFTDADTDKVYTLDSSKGVVSVMSKTGEYEKQYQSDTLKGGDSLVVKDETIYVLKDNKIYKIVQKQITSTTLTPQ